jgi:serine/threonine protein kinase
MQTIEKDTCSVSSEAGRIDPGFAIGPYVVERRLTSVASSQLFVARGADGERVLLKLLHGDAAGGPVRSKLFRELRALAAIDHRNIARVAGCGDHEGWAWVATEYVQGTDLARLLAERGVVPVESALGYGMQIMQGLEAAHDIGLAHRGLKPSNVLFAPDGRIVLVDFGMSNSSLAYLAPEQLEHGLADARSDIWAFGCLLFEMVTGEPPFGRGGLATSRAILRDEPVFPAYLEGPITHIIFACLRKSSFARIGSAREVMALLRDALDDPRVSFPPPHLDGRESPSQRRSARPTTRSSPPPPPSGSNSPSAPRGSPLPSRPASVPHLRSAGSVRVPALRGRIKGTAVRAGLAWFGNTYGGLALQQVGEVASAEVHAALRVGDPLFGIMPSGWYDTQAIGELLYALESVAAPAEPEAFVSRLAEAVAHDNVRGVYRALFRLVASPALFEANAQRVWRTYVDEGSLTVHVRSPASFEARIRGWSRHHAAVCRILRPMLEHMLRAVGYTALVVERTECVGEGATQCSFAGNWIV